MSYLRRYLNWSMNVVEADSPREERVKLAALVLALSGFIMFFGAISLAKAAFDFYFWRYDLQHLGVLGIASDVGMLLTGVYCCTWSVVLYQWGITRIQSLALNGGRERGHS